MAAPKPTQQIIDEQFAKSSAFKHFVLEKLAADEDDDDEVEEGDVPDDETPEAERLRLLTAFTTSKRTDLIFRAKTTELEALAKKLGGTCLLAGHWYYGFKEALSSEEISMMTIKFGLPVTAAKVKLIVEGRIKLQNEAGTKEIIAETLKSFIAMTLRNQKQTQPAVRQGNGRGGRGRGGRGRGGRGIRGRN